MADVEILGVVGGGAVEGEAGSAVADALVMLPITVGEDELDVVGQIGESGRVMSDPVALHPGERERDHAGEDAEGVGDDFAAAIRTDPTARLQRGVNPDPSHVQYLPASRESGVSEERALLMVLGLLKDNDAVRPAVRCELAIGDREGIGERQAPRIRPALEVVVSLDGGANEGVGDAVELEGRMDGHCVF